MVKVVVFKMCPPGACPRMLVKEDKVTLRDDYNKKGFSVKNRLLAKIQTL